MNRLAPLLVFLFVVQIALPCCFGRVQERAHRWIHLANLRQIGQSALIYANDHKGNFPEALDIWDYAALLAADAGADLPSLWQSKTDPASDEHHELPGSFFLYPSGRQDQRQLNPLIRTLKPSYAVVVSGITTNMPATTPIAWTRGLQPDGTWAAHAPNGASGGSILFLGGNVRFFKNLASPDDQLTRFDGRGTTSNILDALPPGARVSEYQPSPDEQREWASKNRHRAFQESLSDYTPLILIVALWTPFVAISIHRFKTRRPSALTVLIWPALITFLAIVILPTC